jgi:fatty-acyl-CoA synthase
MLALPTIPQSVAMHAVLHPEKLAVRNSQRSLTYRLWDERTNRLANALAGIGLHKGDRAPWCSGR